MAILKVISQANPIQNAILSSVSVASALTFSLLGFAAAAHADYAPSRDNPQPRRSSQTTTAGTRNTIAEITNNLYRPPSNPSPRSGSRTTTGTRQGTCLGNQDTPFAALGPDAVVGRTSKSHPSFTWYLPPTENDVPVIFRLLAPNEAGTPTRVHSVELAYTPGYVTYQLPSEVPGLVSGQEYRWQVIIECDPRSPSRALVQELSVERVAASAELAGQLSAAATVAEEAVVYGAQGLWYDAIAPVAQSQSAQEKAIRTELLRNLAEAERTPSPWLDALLEIAERTSNQRKPQPTNLPPTSLQPVAN